MFAPGLLDLMYFMKSPIRGKNRSVLSKPVSIAEARYLDYAGVHFLGH